MSRDEDELDIFQDLFPSKNIFTSRAIGTEGNDSDIVKLDTYFHVKGILTKRLIFAFHEQQAKHD